MDTLQTVNTDKTEGSLREQKEKQGISGSTLKLIAIITMLIDHIGAGILARMIWKSGYMEAIAASSMEVYTAWFAENKTLYITYTVMRAIGRIAFPIFCFLLVEGFQKTHDVKKYALRLGIFALVSEIPFDLAFNAKVLELGYQNVFFTLFLGLLTMIVCDMALRKEWSQKEKLNKVIRAILAIVIIAAGAVFAECLRTDYGAIGVLCIMVLYIFRRRKTAQMLAGAVIFLWEIPAPLAFIPMAFYNGKRGIKLKYVFYAFYPVHLLLIYLVCVYLGIGDIAAI